MTKIEPELHTNANSEFPHRSQLHIIIYKYQKSDYRRRGGIARCRDRSSLSAQQRMR